MSEDITKVIIVGAGRSGTNMLRDFDQFPNWTTWNCDEINPCGNSAIEIDLMMN